MEKKQTDWIVYWIGATNFALWVTRKEAEKIVSDPNTEVSTWLRA